jgi:BlaI family transcriptional regulator, penicillinase repressor
MKSLTKAEEQVMHILWKLGQGFLKDLVEAAPEPKPHSNTIATLLKILVDKGFVEYTVRGRNNLYKPLVSLTDYGKKTAGQLVKGYFEGSPAKLVSHFINDHKLSVQELEELMKQIQSAKNGQS